MKSSVRFALIGLQLTLLAALDGIHPLFRGLTFLPVGLVVMSDSGFERVASGLSQRGIRAQSPASIVGKSGVKHEFALAVLQDAGKTKLVVDTELSVEPVKEMRVLKFYVKVYDVGPEKAVLCVSPNLEPRAADLAKDYGITVLEDDIPKRLVPKVERVVKEALGQT